MAITNINEYKPVIVNQEFDWFPKEVVTAQELNEIFNKFKTQGNYTAEALDKVVVQVIANYDELRNAINEIINKNVPFNSITTDKIVDGAITYDKLGSSVVQDIQTNTQDILFLNEQHRYDLNTLYTYIRTLHGLDTSTTTKTYVWESPEKTTMTVSEETIFSPSEPGVYTIAAISAGGRPSINSTASSTFNRIINEHAYTGYFMDGGGSGACCAGTFTLALNDFIKIVRTSTGSSNYITLYKNNIKLIDIFDAKETTGGYYTAPDPTIFNLLLCNGEQGPTCMYPKSINTTNRETILNSIASAYNKERCVLPPELFTLFPELFIKTTETAPFTHNMDLEDDEYYDNFAVLRVGSLSATIGYSPLDYTSFSVYKNIRNINRAVGSRDTISTLLSQTPIPYYGLGAPYSVVIEKIYGGRANNFYSYNHFGGFVSDMSNELRCPQTNPQATVVIKKND